MPRVYFLDAFGWSQSYLHYRTLDGGWTDAPGQSMERVGHHVGGYEVEAPHGLDEFVITNGEGHWVNNVSGNQGNFKIDSNLSNAHHVVVADRKAFQVPVEDAKSVLLVTDLDGTLVGHDGPHCDHATWRFQSLWKEKVAWGTSVLVYNTGRTLASFLRLREEKSLLTPIALITSCGTEVYWFDEMGRHSKDMAWDSRLDVDNWDLAKVRQAVGHFVDQAPSQSRTVRWRPESEQGNHRLCVETPGQDAVWAGEKLKQALADMGIKIQVIISGAHGWRYIDILTTAGGKLHALRHVRGEINKRLDMDFVATNTVAAGDSGNDIAMFTGNERGIVVGNAQDELLSWMKSEPSCHDRLVRTRGTQADGLVEGLKTMGFMSK